MAAYGNRARLGIPQVNQRPRVKSGVTPLKAAIGNRVRVGGRVGLSNRFAVSAPPTAPSDPFQTANAAAPQAAPKPPAAPPAPKATPAPAAQIFNEPTLTPGQPDPRDATYWSNLAKLKFNDEQEYAKNLQEQSAADTNYNYALQQALQARQGQERNLGLGTIKSGLTASGFHDRTDREQTKAYTEERAHAQISKEEEDQARAVARQALREGYTTEAAALLAEAAGRYGKTKAEEAANGPGEPTPAPGTGAGQHGYKGTGKKVGSFWGPKGPGGYPPPGGRGGGYGGPRGNGGTTAPASAGPSKKQAIAQRRRKVR